MLTPGLRLDSPVSIRKCIQEEQNKSVYISRIGSASFHGCTSDNGGFFSALSLNIFVLSLCWLGARACMSLACSCRFSMKWSSSCLKVLGVLRANFWFNAHFNVGRAIDARWPKLVENLKSSTIVEGEWAGLIFFLPMNGGNKTQTHTRSLVEWDRIFKRIYYLECLF